MLYNEQLVQINEKQIEAFKQNMILNRNSNMEEMKKGITLFELQKDVRRNGVLFGIKI